MKNPPPSLILEGCCQIAKTKTGQEVKCPECGERNRIWGHGSYQRYALAASHQVTVPRFRCLQPRCPRNTFSILPFPFLRIVRHSLCTLMVLAMTLSHGQKSKSAWARELGIGRRSLDRALTKATHVMAWFEREATVARWGRWPPHRPESHWTAFTQAFSHRFYPYSPQLCQPT